MWRSFCQNKIIQVIVLCVGIVLRFVALSQDPQSYDMGTFHAWGDNVLANGLFATYNNVWSDYLPLPMQIFGAISALTHLLPLSFPDLSRLFWMLVESILIYFIVKHYNEPTQKSSLFMVLWLFPPFIFNTSWWGQIDSIPALLTTLAIVLLSQKHALPSAILYALAVCLKPVMLVAGPVFLVLGASQKALPKLLITGILALTLTALPAVIKDLSQFSRYSLYDAFSFTVSQSTFQSSMYPGTTINGWNFWSITGSFWQPDNVSVLGITPQQLGYAIFAFCAFFILRAWHKTKWDVAHAPWVAGSLLLVFYTFTTRMHERHLMFALPLLIVSSQNRLAQIATYLLSLLYLGNLWGALFWVNNSQIWPFSTTSMALYSYLIVASAILVMLNPTTRAFISIIQKIFITHYLATIILILALVLRITALGNPETMIFDEVYHSFTAKEYLHNNVSAWEWWTTPPAGFAYEWTHPPLAKYGMLAGMLLFGENSFGWRIGSAVAGTISILGIYFLTKLITKNKSTAQLAMLLLSFEGLHLVQSRVGMNDAYMFCFLIWSLVFALSRSWKKSAILFGLALSSKWSALYGIIPLGAIYLQQVNYAEGKMNLAISLVARPIRLLVISLIIYLLSFVPFLLSGHTVEHLVELHRQMWYYHTHLVATHDYQSVPWQWLTVTRPVWYYVDYTEGYKANIYAQGNPTLLWFGLFAFIFFLMTSFKKYYLQLLLASIFTLPWFFSPRIMFFYHYLPTGSFLCVLSAMLLTKLEPAWRILIITIFILTFVLMSPVYYGYPVQNFYWDTLFKLFPSWK